ncbi:MAG: cohesin domain-containing protein, partial [Pirellulaceae bacterium]
SPDADNITLSLAGTSAISGSGDVAKFVFEVVGNATTQSPLTVVSARVNDASVDSLSNGSFTVNGYHTVSGTVNYFGDSPVPGADLELVGVGQRQETSADDGSFSISDLQTGAYTLTPSKNDDVREITAHDASLVLQASAGSRSLGVDEKIAADVNKSGAITAVDASYILQHSVGLIEVPFQGAGAVWEFVPENRSYPTINADLTQQDFTAILIGDVSGNWTAEAGQQAAGMTLAGGDGGSAAVTMPVIESRHGEVVAMPVDIELGGEPVTSADLEFHYDAKALRLEDIDYGAAAEGLTRAHNDEVAGEIQVGLASATPFSADGTLLELHFEVLSTLADPAVVSLDVARLNEDAIDVETQDGVIQDTIAPVVTGVYVRSAGWKPGFRDYMHGEGMADADGYYQIPTDGDQLDTLPWSGLSDVRIGFNRDVRIEQGDLRLVGTDAGEVEASQFAYDSDAFTGTWTFPVMGVDKFLLSLSDQVAAVGSGLPLDGEYTDGGGQAVSGDGTAGGDFQFRFNVLPGDTTNSGNVVAGDVSMLASAFGSFASGSGDRYSVFVDFDGSGNVVASDVSVLASHFGQFLPSGEPVLPPSVSTSAVSYSVSASSVSATTDLFPAVSPVNTYDRSLPLDRKEPGKFIPATAPVLETTRQTEPLTAGEPLVPDTDAPSARSAAVDEITLELHVARHPYDSLDDGLDEDWSDDLDQEEDDADRWCDAVDEALAVDGFAVES